MMYDVYKKIGFITFRKNVWKERWKILKAYKKFGYIDDLRKSTFKTEGGKQYNILFSTTDEMLSRIENEFRLNDVY